MLDYWNGPKLQKEMRERRRQTLGFFELRDLASGSLVFIWLFDADWEYKFNLGYFVEEKSFLKFDAPSFFL